MSLQYLSRSSLHGLAGLPCRLFLSYGLQVVTREVHRSSLKRLICRAQDHFIFSRPLPDPDAGISILVSNAKHTSFHFGLCGRKFVLCLLGQCPCLCTICHSWQHTGVVGYTCLFRQLATLLLKISRCLAYAAQPAMILHCTSFHWFFSLRL